MSMNSHEAKDRIFVSTNRLLPFRLPLAQRGFRHSYPLLGLYDCYPPDLLFATRGSSDVGP